MTKICVTGASGKLGRAVVTDLLGHGHEVVATDARPGPPGLGAQVMLADLTEYGEAAEVLRDVEAVVHLANIPAPGIHTPSETFNRNTVMNSNVFLAAAQLGIGRVVWASSETTLGLPFDVPPRYAPVDEDHYPFPTSTYSLSKVVTETLAEHVAQWSGIPFVALRFSNILGPEDYEAFPGYWEDPLLRKWNLWGYIDVRDAAESCRLALTAPVQGARSFVIAAADTVMNRPSAELMKEVFPGVEIRRELGEFETLLAVDAAREALGFTPRHSWRDHL
ncbi:NAD(P)-dependent oxidoreductase [Sphaerisporangium sp. NBC_01403]|uniref:NAD-dependent epimerase/dehydratase family protein n=1 Tax=Sphaerisporangium sp. NBC_01403 TaxID=2903599 RepID=UPI00324E5F74